MFVKVYRGGNFRVGNVHRWVFSKGAIFIGGNFLGGNLLGGGEAIFQGAVF